MAKNELITVYCFNEEVGRLGFDENKLRSSFQFNSDFLNKEGNLNLFPKTGLLTWFIHEFNFEAILGTSHEGI